MKLKRYYLAAICLVCFLAGAYIWKIANTGHYQPLSLAARSALTATTPPGSALVYVGRKPVTVDELEFEFAIHTQDYELIEDVSEPSEGEVSEEIDKNVLQALKESLLVNIIARKLLYQFVKRESSFDANDPSRFTSCLKEWQETVTESQAQFFQTAANQERLKQRLCERSIIDQYLQERVYAAVQVGDTELKNYYDKNREDFHLPKRILIRQIVLPSEKEAKDVQHGLTEANFAERAKQYSITPEAEQGGLLGPFAKGDLPRLFDVAFSLRRGEIYGILKSTYGFHLIKLERKLEDEILSFEKAKPQITKKLLKQKQDEEYQKWLEKALNAISVTPPTSVL